MMVRANSDLPERCGVDDWQPFALAFSTTGAQGQPDGLLVWCNAANWEIRAIGDLEPEWLAAPGNGADVFDWFSPVLDKDQAWTRGTRLAPELFERPVRPVGQSGTQPTNPLASSALLHITSLGREFRMEFSEEGIPVVLSTPGVEGVRFWATRLDRAWRVLMSDDDVFQIPICDSDGARSEQDPALCRNSLGRLEAGTGCELSFATAAAGARRAVCSL